MQQRCVLLMGRTLLIGSEQDGFETLMALVDDLGLEVNCKISYNSTIASIAAAYPTLVVRYLRRSLKENPAAVPSGKLFKTP